MVRATRELESVIQQIVHSYSRTVELINLLSDMDTKAVLELHYLEGLTLEEIRKNNRLQNASTG